MKNTFFAWAFFALASFGATAQTEVRFSKEEQAEIQKILGKEFTAVLGSKGQLAVVAPKDLGRIKVTQRGGITGSPSKAANAVFAAYEKAWVYRQSSKQMLEKILGQERFKQLETIMVAKGLKM